MQGVIGAYKLEKRFWENVPKGVEPDSWADSFFMKSVDWAIKECKHLAPAQVVEIHRAWTSVKKKTKGNITTEKHPRNERSELVATSRIRLKQIALAER